MQRKFGVKVLRNMKINSDHLSCQFVKNARPSRAVSDCYTYDLYYVKYAIYLYKQVHWSLDFKGFLALFLIDLGFYGFIAYYELLIFTL